MFVLLVKFPDRQNLGVHESGEPCEVPSIEVAARDAREGCHVVDAASIPSMAAHAVLSVAIPDPAIPRGERAQCPKGHFHIHPDDWVKLVSGLPRIRVGSVLSGRIVWDDAREEDLPDGLRVTMPAGRA